MRPVSICLLSVCLYLSMPGAFAADDVSQGKEIAALENQFFETSYNAEAMDSRLSRLEKLVFGETRSGSQTDRVASLVNACPPPIAPPISSSGSAQPISSSANGLANNGDATASGDDRNWQTTQNDQQGANQQGSDQQETDDVIADSSDYPHVTALEHEILGKTFVADPVEARLARLESKAFGKQAANPDLSARTDNLEQYVDLTLHKRPFAINPQMETSAKDEGWSIVPAAYVPPPASPATLASVQGPPPGPDAPMLKKVSWLEYHIYGHTFSNLHLLDRLRQLDVMIFPADRQKSNVDLMDQADAMIGAVVAHQYEQEAVVPPIAPTPAQRGQIVPVSYQQPGGSNYCGVPSSTYDPGQVASSQAAPDSGQANDHPLFKSFAKALGLAAGMATGI